MKFNLFHCLAPIIHWALHYPIIYTVLNSVQNYSDVFPSYPSSLNSHLEWSNERKQQDFLYSRSTFVAAMVHFHYLCAQDRATIIIAKVSRCRIVRKRLDREMLNCMLKENSSRLHNVQHSHQKPQFMKRGKWFATRMKFGNITKFHNDILIIFIMSQGYLCLLHHKSNIVILSTKP